jgi:hypothetical protein
MSTNAGTRRQPSYPQVRVCEEKRALMMHIGCARGKSDKVYLWPISVPCWLRRVTVQSTVAIMVHLTSGQKPAVCPPILDG